MHRPLQPEGWPRPAGYANGVVARGRAIFLAGQVGWNAEGRFESHDLVAQIAQALRNVAAILASTARGRSTSPTSFGTSSTSANTSTVCRRSEWFIVRSWERTFPR